nr:hypothetical protein Iba_chr06eCG9780 [Ipomoea batatas]
MSPLVHVKKRTEEQRIWSPPHLIAASPDLEESPVTVIVKRTKEMVAAASHRCFAGSGEGLAGHCHRSLLRLLIWVAEGGKVNIEDDGGGRLFGG